MGSSCPPPWTFAGRAAYFGDRICGFCDHHNPAGARFCNECGSPLHFKPCKQCDAVNEAAVTHCYQCGAAYPAPSGAGAAPALEAARTIPASASPTDAGTGVTELPTSLATAALRAGRLFRTHRLLVVAMATVTIVGIHYWHRADIVLDGPAVRPVPDGQGIASPPVPASESGAAITPVVPVVMESVGAATRAVASEPVPATSANAAIAAVEEPVPAALQDDAAVSSPAPPARTEAKPRASAPRRGATAAPDKRAIAHERPTPKRHAAPATMPPAPRGTGAARVRSRVAHAVKKRHPDRWHVMYASLASCGGDLIDRIVCDQRVRLRFCNGYWGEVPQCGGDGAREQGQ